MKSRWQDALPKPGALVFSGGAAQGAIQMGMLKALAAMNLQPDLIVGTSFPHTVPHLQRGAWFW